MDSEVASIFIMVCLWYWTASKISITISPLREENRWHRRLAHLAFGLLTLIQLLSLIAVPRWSHWLVSLGSALTVLYILIMASLDREGFWSKARNQVVGGCVILGAGVGMPFVFSSVTMIPLFFGILLAQEFHKVQNKQFASSIRDLDSIRGKVCRLEADLANGRQGLEAPKAKRPVSVPERLHALQP